MKAKELMLCGMQCSDSASGCVQAIDAGGVAPVLEALPESLQAANALQGGVSARVGFRIRVHYFKRGRGDIAHCRWWEASPGMPWARSTRRPW